METRARHMFALCQDPEPVTQRSVTRLISSWEPFDVEWPEVADQLEPGVDPLYAEIRHELETTRRTNA